MTLKDLAKIAGVSISTVSKALNDSPEIGERTKKKINELAKLYKYQPNNIAVNLKTGKTKNIGVIIPSIQNNFFARAIVGIEKILDAEDYKLIISITHESQAKEAAIIKTLSNGVVDGFIIAVAEETQINQETEHFLYTQERNKPTVLFDRVIKSLDFNNVVVDDNASVYNLTQGLIKNGKKAIAVVSAIHNLSVGKSRKEGYLKAIENKQNPIIVEAEIDDLAIEIETLLNTKHVDAIIGFDEDASLWSLKVAKRKNILIPEKLVILGFAPTKLAQNLSPQLTTINQHGVTIGETSAKLLLDKLKNPSLPPQRIVVNSTIDHRETTQSTDY